MSFDFPLILDGAGRVATGERESRLARAVISSLFTWARARDGDELPTPESPRMGFWGDTYSPVTGDRWGSRLWLLSRAKLTAAQHTYFHAGFRGSGWLNTLSVCCWR